MTENLLDQALHHHKAHRLDEAKVHYLARLKENPEDPDANYLLGTLLSQQGFLAESHDHLKKSLKHHPNPAMVYVALGHVAKQTGQLQDAMGLYKSALKLDSTLASAHLSLGHAQRLEGNLDQAMGHYQNAAKHAPSWDEPPLHITMILQLQGKQQEAKEMLDGLIKRFAKHPSMLKHRGQISQQEGQYNEAIKWLLKSLEIAPEDAHTHHLLGAAYSQINENDIAITHFESALHLAPKDADSHHNLAALYYQKGEWDEARLHWLRQLELKPDEHSHYNIGQTYYQQGRHTEAIPYFNETLKRQPKYENAWIALGAMAIKDEDYKEAIRCYEQVLAINPNHKQVQYTLAALTGNATEQHLRAPDDYVEHLFDEYAPHFDQHLQGQLNYRVPDTIRLCLEEHIRFDPKKIIVDIGCGTGLCGTFLKPWSNKLIGVDLSNKMLDIAKKKNLYHELVQDDAITYLAKQNQSFDLIVAADVLPYLGDLSKILKNAKKALKKDGFLVLTTEAHNEEEDYRLQPNARFAHGFHYLEACFQTIGLHCITHESFISRTQNNQGVKSHLFLLKKAQ